MPPKIDKRMILAAGGAVAAVGALAVLIAGRGGEIAGALASVPIGIVFALAGLQAAIYLCRVSSWNVALRCGDAGLCANQVRGASGLAFTVNIVLPGYVGAAARVALLRRLGRSTDVGIGQLAMIDVLTLAIEASFLMLLAIPLVAIFAPGFLWLPLGLLGLVLCGFALAGPLRRRLGHLSWTRSLEIFRSPRELLIFSLPLLAVIIINPIRFWLALAALGVPAGLGLAVVAFIIVSVVAVIPIGGAQAGIGGLGILFASHGTDVILAAGVVLAATAALGAVIYLIAITAIWAAQRVRVPALAPQPV